MHRKRFDASHTGPLRGVKVVDLSRLVAGNMLTLQLADFGADVIKVEPLKGDTLRAFRTQGAEVFWKAYARNKKSICIDFRHETAASMIASLARDADVLVESFKPGTLEKMGLAPQTLLEANPKLVIVRVSGWGQTGPFRHRPGFGTLVEGYSGFAAMNGFSDREPVLPPMFLGDMTAGLYGAHAAMVALWEARMNGGNGQVVDLSLFDPMISILGPQVANYQITGRVKARTGSRSSTTAPRNTYETADGKWLCVSTSTQTMAERLFTAIGCDEMNADPRYLTNTTRLQHVEEVDRVVGGFIKARTLADNLVFFEQADVTVGPVYHASDLADDAYVSERESIVEIEDEELGHVAVHNVVARLSGTPGGFMRPAPKKGEHSREILAPLLGERVFDELIGCGAVIDAACV
ncbi:crotonobetainyl-CoA:carnitine CoA-transferase CaiB-like acyl-CoA transferase [Paraburkholderia sp. GAS199]|uniref:CaiB/BaiF CoA transferase family protein n=1 Tax=Paraburkholderia sp. GAS199 TaxID=3035126 RepID=UPI003D2491E2